MKKDRTGEKETVVWWEELKSYKKDNWCCSVLKEGAVEEHLKFEFDDAVPVKFNVNYCCHCGKPVREGFKPKKEGKEDWCCRVMKSLRLEQLEFSGGGKRASTLQASYCFHCGREIRKHSDEGKIHNREEGDKRD